MRMDDLGDKMFYSMKFHAEYINTFAKKTKCLLKVLLLLPATNNVSDVNSIKQCTCTISSSIMKLNYIQELSNCLQLRKSTQPAIPTTTWN